MTSTARNAVARRAQQTGQAPQPGGNDFDEQGFTFRPATKEQAKARVALQGISGSGKTWTGLALAAGLGDRFAVIDTERGAASKYVGINNIQFDVLQMSRYDPRDLVKALGAAAKAGYPTVMVDSLSHFWKGTDGTLEQVDRAKSRYGGNSFGGWKEGTPIQNAMIDALLAYPGHIVVTMRSHTEWVLQENDRGTREPVQVGTRAEQRKGVEYEFDVVGAMDVNNTLTILKSRCPSLHQQVVQRPDGSVLARQLLEWLDDGAPVADPADYITRAIAHDATYKGLLDLYAEVDGRGLLATPMLDPADGSPTSLGDYIRTRGTALKVTQ
ncbi:ATP-binding protein [Streptomyces abikoensis]|uniref:ATP-binding protein n=1 Tax=Streptomyces abikoensis TaxID=97398 RepID=UPI003400148A